MIHEEPAFILTFPTMTEVFEARECCQKNDITVDLIPMPGKITAGCGTAVKADPKDQERILEVLRAANIEPNQETVIEVDS